MEKTMPTYEAIILGGFILSLITSPLVLWWLNGTKEVIDMPEPDEDEQEIQAWEKRVFGNDLRYAELVSEEDDQLLDECLGLQVGPVRLEKELVAELDRIAKKEGLADHVVLIRNLVMNYARAKRDERS